MPADGDLTYNNMAGKSSSALKEYLYKAYFWGTIHVDTTVGEDKRIPE